MTPDFKVSQEYKKLSPREKAESCIEDMTLRLAKGADAQIVARAAIKSCEGDVENAVLVSTDYDVKSFKVMKLSPRDPMYRELLQDNLDQQEKSKVQARESLSDYALLKAVQDKAGNCQIPDQP